MTTRVIIVRHGQSTYNTQQLIQGRTDESVLTENGSAEARNVGEAISCLHVDAVYSSPLKRAKQTAEIILSYLQPTPKFQTHPSLLEIDLPLWEKLHKSEVKEKFPEDYRCWRERPHEFYMTCSTAQGESQHFPVVALHAQAQQFWQDMLPRHAGQTVVIVAHNGINRCLISSALGIPKALYHSIRQSNGGINVLNFAGAWGEPVQLESLNQTAHLGYALPTPGKSDRGVRLLLVRHGETEWNRTSRFQGGIDVPLNQTGRQQGQQVAEFLRDVSIDFAISSPMLRPKETAEIILQSHPNTRLELKEELREINHGLWEGKFQPEIAQLYPDVLQQWLSAPETVQMPQGENLQQVWQRATACWDEIVTKGVNSTEDSQTGLVVAHDAINKVILCHILGLMPASFWQIKQGNGAVSVIDYPKGSQNAPVLQAMNITSHLSGSVLDTTATGAL